MLRQIIIFTLLGACLGGQSPNADKLQDILGQTRYSNNINEDASLDVPSLVKKYGYPLEEYEAQTEDGYLLTVHRIPHGRHNADESADRPVVFLMHGLLSSSADWILTGPGKGFAYILADAGYDVWLGNARGNYYSRKHVSLVPANPLNPFQRNNFWQFSWHEIGHYDLPVMIDLALLISGKSKLHYAGFSQGTTSFFVLASTRPEYNSKIISMQALAPIAYMNNLFSPFIRAIAPFADVFDSVLNIFGINEFLPNFDITTSLGGFLCRDNNPTQFICSNVLFLIAGYSVDQLNTTILPIIMGHTPAGSSSRQLVHYGQGINSAKFRHFNHGPISNIGSYGSIRPPDYPLNRITAPVALHYSDNDWLADVGDVDRLFKQLPNAIGKFRVPKETFNHLDFTYAIDAPTLVYERVLNIMAQFN